MPKISEERRQLRRQCVIDAAVKVLQERGFAGASMAEIIAASGMSAGAIYGYFPGKKELFQAAAHQVLGQRLSVLERTLTGEVPPPEEALEAFFAVLREGEEGSRMIVQMWGQAVHDADMRAVASEVIGGARGAVQGYLEAWYAQEGAPDPADRAREGAGLVLALAQGSLVQSALLGEPLFHLENGLSRMLR